MAGKKEMWFSGYGMLEYIPKEKYFAGNFRYVGSETEEGTIESLEAGDELFDIVANNDTEEYFYTQICEKSPEYYIFEKNFIGSDMIYERINGKYQPVIIEASDKDEALNIYLRTRDLEVDRELYFARDKEAYDEDKRKLKETGYDSWDDYYRDMYPERPIEL